MKIAVRRMPYREVMMIPPQPHQKPASPSFFFRCLIRLLAGAELKKTHFSYESIGMERLQKDEPCLILMNHSGFIDLKIAYKILFPRKINIVCTSDGFVGKERLMRAIGCIPTKKFVTDVVLVKDMLYCMKKLRNSVLMFPEASYSFDGTATPLPSSLGKCIKALKVPVVMIRTHGAFARNPLYNNLQNREVDVSATVEYLLSAQEIEEKSAEELNKILEQQFDFDNFKWQKENQVRVKEPFRADYLNRVLYKCPHCLAEGKTVGKGINWTCNHCGASYELTEYGDLRAINREAEFTHVPDWYRWERECVRRELEEGTYGLDIPVDICIMKDMKNIYQVGSGRLTHDRTGFHLTGCDGQLDYYQKPSASYSLYSDYYWYELGDMICIGNTDLLYYCFPKDSGDVVAKTRLATEELFKYRKQA